jgi:hypothetical protein
MAESAAQAEIRRLQQQLAQAEAALAEQSDSVDPEEADRMRQHSVDPEEAERMRQHEIRLRRQEEEENNRARHHELEMARLQLQIEQAKAANSMPAAINITQREDKVASFKKEVAAKSLKTSFKLEGSTNYESWRDEALTQALAIKAKHILINKEMACPAGITDDDERKIWEVKSEALFDMLLAGVKPAIRQTIKARINEDDKSATELWMAMETEFRIHAVDIRTDLFRRFTTATIEANNVQQYISQFRDTCGKLKQMGFEIPIWQQTERFIDGLKGFHATFIRTKRDEIRDPKNKGKITELDLEELMDQLIARAIDHKDRQKPAQAFKAEDKPDEEPDSTPSRQSSTRGSRPNRGHNSQQGYNKCGYCDRPNHDESNCVYKNYSQRSEEWQTIHASAIEYFKKKNEGKSTSSKPKSDSMPSTPSTPSTPTPIANPNVGFTAIAFSANSSTTKDLNWYLDSGASYHMTPFRDRFTTFLPIKANPAGGITGHEIMPQGIGTIRQQIDDQVLEVPYVQYIPNIVASLLSYRQLEKQGFRIESAPMEDGTSLFEITDPQGQTFRAIPSASGVYPINGVTNPTALAAKARRAKKAATDESPPPPPTTEVDDDLPIESDEDESSDVSIGGTIHVIPRNTTIRTIPKAVGAGTTILNPIQAIPKAVGATNKEEMTYQAPSRSGTPRKRRGRLKQQSLVDPVVLLARELNWTKSNLI